jgi:ligand-binding SRPBCC domain-containing protein
MPRFIDEIRIDAPKEAVWAKIADLGAIEEYHPGVARSYYTSEARVGLAASRHCDLRPFGQVEERVVEWRDGDSYALEIYSGKKMPPMKRAVGRLRLTRDGDGTTVRFEIDYELRHGALGKLLDRAMVRRRFSKVGPAMLRGLKRHLEAAGPARARSNHGREATHV